ncbi:MAG: hypothetical protein GEU73_05585 [Chloroflexi bacterium]|nr:hypothetical protein [Chloroflexota bacterium]
MSLARGVSEVIQEHAALDIERIDRIDLNVCVPGSPTLRAATRPPHLGAPPARHPGQLAGPDWLSGPASGGDPAAVGHLRARRRHRQHSAPRLGRGLASEAPSFVYQLTLLHRFETGGDLLVGLKAILRAA